MYLRLLKENEEMTREEAHTLLEVMAINITDELISSGHVITEQTKLRTKQLEAIDMAIEILSADKPQGKWIKEYNGDGWNDYWDYKCSNCGKVYKRAGAILYDANYCPNCSAKMGDTK